MLVQEDVNQYTTQIEMKQNQNGTKWKAQIEKFLELRNRPNMSYTIETQNEGQNVKLQYLPDQIEEDEQEDEKKFQNVQVQQQEEEEEEEEEPLTELIEDELVNFEDIEAYYDLAENISVEVEFEIPLLTFIVDGSAAGTISAWSQVFKAFAGVVICKTTALGPNLATGDPSPCELTRQVCQFWEVGVRYKWNNYTKTCVPYRLCNFQAFVTEQECLAACSQF